MTDPITDPVTDAAISVSGLTKHYGDLAVVKGIDLIVPRGVCFGLLGPNGAGKTTTIGMLLGIVPPTSGNCTVLGHRIPEAAPTARQRIGVVPQEDNLDPDFTVAENLRVYASYFGLKDINPRIDELLEFVELNEKRDVRIPTLSGGMKRRLTIARALINNPDLIVLDEPTTGLDPQARHLIWSRLNELKRSGKTLLLTTHYMEEAERLCDEISVIDHGEIMTGGTPDELRAKHVEREVFEFPGAPTDVASALNQLAHVRCEKSGTSYYVYTNNPEPVLAAIRSLGQIGYLHRPTNLEDVFLTLTKRDLRD